MRASVFIAVPAFAAAVFAQSGNPALSYKTQTNSLGVPTGQPLPVTTQPAPVTTQPAAATEPANTTLIVKPPPAGTGVTPVGTGSVSASTNGTFTRGSPTSSATSGSGSGSSTTSSGSSTTTSGAAAGMLEPALGLGLAGALFAAFL